MPSKTTKAKQRRLREVTGTGILRAASLALRNIEKDDHMTATEMDAGFILPDQQKAGRRLGYQVFVKVARFSEELLDADPVSGGLLANRQRKKK